jgi:hypothetical protein
MSQKNLIEDEKQREYMTHVNFYAPHSLWKEYRRIALEKGTSASQIAIKAMKEYIKA